METARQFITFTAVSKAGRNGALGFRPHLAMMPLRFANPSPPSDWIEDFHLRAVVHARHTEKEAARGRKRPKSREETPKVGGSSTTKVALLHCNNLPPHRTKCKGGGILPLYC